LDSLKIENNESYQITNRSISNTSMSIARRDTFDVIFDVEYASFQKESSKNGASYDQNLEETKNIIKSSIMDRRPEIISFWQKTSLKARLENEKKERVLYQTNIEQTLLQLGSKMDKII